VYAKPRKTIDPPSSPRNKEGSKKPKRKKEKGKEKKKKK